MNNAYIRDAIERKLTSLEPKNSLSCLIFSHRQADPDALCSAGALKLLLETSIKTPKLNTTLIAPQGASLLGKQVSASMRIDFVEKIDRPSILNSDVIFVVDTGDPKLLEPYAQDFNESHATKFLVDHHPSSMLPDVWEQLDEKFVISGSTSTSEIITLGFPSELITKQIANMLLAGLLFDSQHLGIATKNTLEAALVLVSAGAEIAASKRLLRHEPDRSEVLGRLKAAQRLRFEEAGEHFIARSEISSFHAAVARMLVDIGADIGIAYGESGGEARLSARSSQSFFRETSIDLSVEIKKVSDYFGLIGGGHSTAASLSGKMNDSSLLADRLVQNIKSILLQK